MAKIVVPNCDNCSKKEGNCCKGCFTEKKTNIFNSLTDYELDVLIRGKKQIQYEPGEIIVKQNDATNFGLCVKEGFAKVHVESEKNNNLIIQLAIRRDFICGGSIFNELNHTYSVTALTPVTCCLIDSSTFKKLISSNQEFANEILIHKSKQYHYYLQKLIQITQKYAPGRIADTLLYLKNEIFRSNPFTAPLTRQELAEMSNLARENFIRGLKEFEDSDIIAVRRNTFEILKEDILLEISKNG
jgi:CRP-like cAMP-binding protein